MRRRRVSCCLPCARALARFFQRRPGAWVDGATLARVAGFSGWLTRVSELRQPPFSMTIVNRQRSELRADGRTVRVSEYSFIPSDTGSPARATEARVTR